jgi:N-acetylglucosamine-6-sulfatase
MASTQGEQTASSRGLVLAGLAALLWVAVSLPVAIGARNADTAAAKAKMNQAEPPPNVLIIETDDQDQASLRVMPNVNALIGEKGVAFPHSFVNYPLCCPSRATRLTGQYAHNHGVLDNQEPNGGFDKLDSANTLPVWLQRSGYYTGLIGKYLNGYEAHRDDPGGPLIPPGYSEWQGTTRTYTFYGYEVNENGTLVQYGSQATNPDSPGNPANYSGDVFTGKAVDFVARRAPSSQPFFLWLSYLAPHSGGPNPDPPNTSHCAGTAKPAPRHLHAFDAEVLPQPPSFNEVDVSDKPQGVQQRTLFSDEDISDLHRFYRCRLASLLAIDEGVAQIIGMLSATGELANTLIVFTADNGFMHGEHRVKSGKFVPYEESIQVPLLIRGPGFPKGKTIRDLATNVDIVKTIVKATEADSDRRLDGFPLQGFDDNPVRERGRELLIETDQYAGVRTRRYVYVEYFAGNSAGDKELYDLDTDPFQLNNLVGASSYDAVESALAKRLASLRGCSGDGCRKTPHLRMKLRKNTGPGGCVERPLTALIVGADRSKLVLGEFYVNGDRVRRDRARPFKDRLPFRKVARKRKAKLRIRGTLKDGRRITKERRVRACR